MIRRRDTRKRLLSHGGFAWHCLMRAMTILDAQGRAESELRQHATEQTRQADSID
jgi:hypothetical protein